MQVDFMDPATISKVPSFPYDIVFFDVPSKMRLSEDELSILLRHTQIVNKKKCKLYKSADSRSLICACSKSQGICRCALVLMVQPEQADTVRDGLLNVGCAGVEELTW